MNITPQNYSIKDAKKQPRILPAATVILLRDVVNSLEILLLRRNTKLSFEGGAWVFPGGQIDPGDYVKGAESNLIAAARQAAIREAKEEAGILLTPENLIPMSCWTTPDVMPKRFKAWFFVAAAKNSNVRIDGNEIHDYRWIRPDRVLDVHRAGKMKLPPPTFISILKLSAYKNVSSVLSDLAGSSPVFFTPRNLQVPNGACSLYEEDSGYPDMNLDRPGKRHRLWMLQSGWLYENS
jgi:8-oxo-dGTP pyrophosphatase MutT (NUDIX family)